MTYENFKLCVIQQAAETANYPNVLNAIQQTVARAGNLAADEILAIAYADYCFTHGITE